MGGITASDLYGVFKFLLGLEFALLALHALGSVLNLVRLDQAAKEFYVLRAKTFSTFYETYAKKQSLLEEQAKEQAEAAEKAEATS